MSATIDLHAAFLGEGPPVVLVHSSGMSSRQWRRLAEVLSPRHRTIAPDLIGSGQSPPWPDDAPFHHGRDVDAIAAIVRGAGEPVHLVGHSYGGLLALTIARTMPDRVRSVAVYDPVTFGVLHEPGDAEGLADLAKAGSDPVFHDDAVGGTEPWLELFVDYWNGAGAWRALPQPARDAFLRVGRKVYLEVSSLMADRTGASAYASITAPTLLLGGGQSPPAARRVVAILGEAIAGARVTTVEGAGHMGPMTHAGDVNEAIAAHIASAQ